MCIYTYYRMGGATAAQSRERTAAVIKEAKQEMRETRQVCVCICMCICVCVCVLRLLPDVCVCIYIYIYMYTHTHVYT